MAEGVKNSKSSFCGLTFLHILLQTESSKLTGIQMHLSLQVDGEIRQKGYTKDMIFRIPYLISHISSIMTLFEGDVILTGTLADFSCFQFVGFDNLFGKKYA